LRASKHNLLERDVLDQVKITKLKIWIMNERKKIKEAHERGQDTQWLNGFDCAITRVQNKMHLLEL